jgi:hypothetical protein
MRKKVNSKCYMCERRHPACQDKCPDYLAWKANLDATNAKIKDEKKKFEDMGSYLDITGTAMTWYWIAGGIAVGGIVAYVAMNGYDGLYEDLLKHLHGLAGKSSGNV